MDNIKNCIFCQKALSDSSSLENNIYYYCYNGKCKEHYVEIHYEKNDLSKIVSIHIASIRLRDKKYRVMYMDNFLKVYFSNSEKLICDIELLIDKNGKCNLPITPNNCQSKLANYLLYL